MEASVLKLMTPQMRALFLKKKYSEEDTTLTQNEKIYYDSVANGNIVPINIIPDSSFPTRQNTGGGNMQMPNSSVGGSAVSPWNSQNADNMISMGIMIFFLMMIMSLFKRG